MILLVVFANITFSDLYEFQAATFNILLQYLHKSPNKAFPAS